MLSKPTIEKSYIRFFHVFPSPLSVDVYVDKKLMASDILYEDFTEYLSIPCGEHTIIVTKNKNSTPLITKSVHLANNGIYTSIIASKQKDAIGIDINFIEDTKRAIPSNNLLCRFAHYSNALSNIDITLSDGSSIFKNIAPCQVTNYIMLKQGTYTICIRDINTSRTLLNVENIRLKPSRFYSMYAIGTNKKEFPIQLVIPIDGNSYLRF